MNKVFAAFWYSGILPLLFCTTTIPTTTTLKNHESLSRPEPAKKEGTKAKQNRKQNREKGFLWLKDKWRSVADKSSACYKNGGMRQSSSFSDVQSRGVGSSIGPIYSYSSVHGGVEGESAQRCKPRLERHRRTAERAAKALAEKNRLLEEEQHLQAAVERATAEARQRAFQKLIAEEAAFEAELSRLTKVVQESKTEFSRRKSSRNLQVSSSKTEISTSPYKTRGKHTEPIPQSSTENRDNVQDSGVFVTEEGECASSVLTEEPQPEVLEMDRLEAELESELQKLPWCSTEASGFEGKISDICEFNTDIHVQDSGVFVTEEGECANSVLTEEPQPEVLEMDRLEAELESELQKLPWCSTEASGFEGKISDICENEDASFKGFYKPDGQTSDSCQSSGVLPSELDQKLCHLLIEQQESQIVGLESELHWAQSKLHEKEAEFQALKDCLKHLTEFSLATASDEESEAQKEEERIIDHGDYDNKMGPESKRSVVGMKRLMDLINGCLFPSYYYKNVTVVLDIVLLYWRYTSIEAWNGFKGKLKLRDCQGRNVGERRRFISFASLLQTL